MAVSYTFLQTGEFQALVDRVTALENQVNTLEAAPSEVNYIQFADYDPEVALPHETLNVIVGTIDELKTLLPSEDLPGDTLAHTLFAGWDPAEV